MVNMLLLLVSYISCNVIIIAPFLICRMASAALMWMPTGWSAMYAVVFIYYIRVNALTVVMINSKQRLAYETYILHILSIVSPKRTQWKKSLHSGFCCSYPGHLLDGSSIHFESRYSFG